MKTKKSKNSPKIFTIDFLLQNYADIIGTFIVLILISLLFEPTSKYTFRIVSPSHNLTDPVTSQATGLPQLYTFGVSDILCVLYYLLVCIVFHAIVQQYLLDKSSRKLHLSKIKNSKFNESGQLLIFYISSLIWALDILRRDRSSRNSWAETIGGIQEGMTYEVKFYYIVQLAYWLHLVPVYYLMRMKKEEIVQRSTYISLYLPALLLAYVGKITRTSLVFIVVHYFAESFFHLARLLSFKQSESNLLAFKVWNFVFVSARVISISVSYLVFGLGFGFTPNYQKSTYHFYLRIFMLIVNLGLQAHMTYNFLVFQIARLKPVVPVAETKKSTRKHD